jgi:UDP:flavonoid glycosyltransferase YjiC (YdhE family)
MKVLLVPFAPSLAHVGRCLAMAEILKAAGFQILFAIGPERISMIQKAGFETRPLPEVSGAAFRSERGFGWLTGGFTVLHHQYFRRRQ